jgi:hypothetical protein
MQIPKISSYDLRINLTFTSICNGTFFISYARQSLYVKQTIHIESEYRNELLFVLNIALSCVNRVKFSRIDTITTTNILFNSY